MKHLKSLLKFKKPNLIIILLFLIFASFNSFSQVRKFISTGIGGGGGLFRHIDYQCTQFNILKKYVL